MLPELVENWRSLSESIIRPQVGTQRRHMDRFDNAARTLNMSPHSKRFPLSTRNIFLLVVHQVTNADFDNNAKA